MVKITKNFNTLHAQNCSKGVNLKPIHICKNLFENLLEPKRMQVFPFKLQYQKKLTDFFKNKTVKASENHLISNSNVRRTL